MKHDQYSKDDRICLSALIHDWETGGDEIVGVDAEFFYDNRAQKLVGLLKSDIPRDQVALMQTATNIDYVTMCVSEMGLRDHFEHYYQRVKDNWLKRESRKIYLETEDMEGLETVYYLMERLGKIESAVTPGGSDDSHERFLEALESENMCLPVDIPALDKMIGGFELGSYVVVGSRPSVGKTAFACTLAYNLAKRGISVGFYSVESPIQQIRRRFVARMTGIPNEKIRIRKFDGNELERCRAASEQIQELPLNLYQSSGHSRETIAMQMLTGPHTVCIVDHLSLIPIPKGEKEYDAVTRASALLAGVAKRKNKIVIAVSQLSREVEKRTNGRPVMSDLRASGAVEQDADVILFPWPSNPEDLREGSCISSLDMDITVAKNRDGSTGPVRATFNRDGQFFHEWGIDVGSYQPNEEPGF